MKKFDIDLALVALAASRMSVKEFEDFIDQINLMDIEHARERFRIIRNHLMHVPEKNKKKEQIEDSMRSLKSQVIKDILMLIDESKLPQSLVATRLEDRFSKLQNSDKLPEFNQKMGLSRWLARVLNILHPNVVLNEALQEVAGELDSKPGSWRLSEK